MSPPKDPEKFREWISHQKPRVQKRWLAPGALDAYFKLVSDRARASAVKGKNHPNWKGEKIKYNSIHLLISKEKPRPDRCSICGVQETTTKKKSGRMQSNLTIASIDHKYTRNPDDYVWICTKCHQKMDRTPYNRLTRAKWHQFFNQYYQANITQLPRFCEN